MRSSNGNETHGQALYIAPIDGIISGSLSDPKHIARFRPLGLKEA